MSGGSHNYLCYRETSDLLTWGGVRDLDYMATSLIEKDAVDIARDTLRLKNYIEQTLTRVEVMQEGLEDIFRAVEWEASGDIGEESLKKEIEKYRGGSK